MPPLGLDHLRAPVQGHRQPTGSGQEHEPVPVACAHPLLGRQVPTGGHRASGAGGSAGGAGRPPGRDGLLAAHQPPDRSGPVLAGRLFPRPCGQRALEYLRWNAAQRGNACAGLGVEVDLAVRVQHAGEVLLAADVGDGGEQVTQAEVVAGGEPVQERQRQLALQRSHPSCHPAGQGRDEDVGRCRLASRVPAAGRAAGRGRAVLLCHAGCPYFPHAGRAWLSAAASSSTSASSCLVIRSVPSVMAIRAASRMRWERLPIRPAVRVWR